MRSIRGLKLLRAANIELIELLTHLKPATIAAFRGTKMDINELRTIEKYLNLVSNELNLILEEAQKDFDMLTKETEEKINIAMEGAKEKLGVPNLPYDYKGLDEDEITSVSIAGKTGRQHKTVLKDIRRSFKEGEFKVSTYQNKYRMTPQPMYILKIEDVHKLYPLSYFRRIK